jgi:hypothetical protein
MAKRNTKPFEVVLASLLNDPRTQSASSEGQGVLKVSFFMRGSDKSELVTRGDFRHFGAYVRTWALVSLSR